MSQFDQFADSPFIGKSEAEAAIVLSEEEAGVARRLLARLIDNQPDPTGGGATPGAAAPRAQTAVDLARAVFQSRKRRAEHFGPALFSEPAWDMLLILFVYGDRGDSLSVSRLAEFSDAPLTTAIRWLDYLESQRLILRRQCEFDRRKYFVTLSEKGRTTMTSYFEGLQETL